MTLEEPVRSSDVDRLIHEPARLSLISHLFVVDEADFVYLSRQTGLTAGNISSHMSKLEAVGYVEIDKTFVERRPRTIYRLTDTGRAAFERYRRIVTDIMAVSEEASG